MKNLERVLEEQLHELHSGRSRVRGVCCSRCGQNVALRRGTFHYAQKIWLDVLYEKSGGDPKVVVYMPKSVDARLRKERRKDYTAVHGGEGSLIRRWGLAEMVRPGYYRITRLGIKVHNGVIRIHRHIATFNGNMYGAPFGPKIDIDEAARSGSGRNGTRC